MSTRRQILDGRPYAHFVTFSVYRRGDANYFGDFGKGARFWQPKYYSFEIHERRKMEEKLE